MDGNGSFHPAYAPLVIGCRRCRPTRQCNRPVSATCSRCGASSTNRFATRDVKVSGGSIRWESQSITGTESIVVATIRPP